MGYITGEQLVQGQHRRKKDDKFTILYFDEKINPERTLRLTAQQFIE